MNAQRHLEGVVGPLREVLAAVFRSSLDRTTAAERQYDLELIHGCAVHYPDTIAAENVT